MKKVLPILAMLFTVTLFAQTISKSKKMIFLLSLKKHFKKNTHLKKQNGEKKMMVMKPNSK